MTASPPFLGLPDRLDDGGTPRIVIFGAGHGTTYPGKDSSGYVGSANAIRAASQEDAGLIEHWDFDLGGCSTASRSAASIPEICRPTHGTMPETGR